MNESGMADWQQILNKIKRKPRLPVNETMMKIVELLKSEENEEMRLDCTKVSLIDPVCNLYKSDDKYKTNFLKRNLWCKKEVMLQINSKKNVFWIYCKIYLYLNWNSILDFSPTHQTSLPCDQLFPLAMFWSEQFRWDVWETFIGGVEMSNMLRKNRLDRAGHWLVS